MIHLLSARVHNPFEVNDVQKCNICLLCKFTCRIIVCKNVRRKYFCLLFEICVDLFRTLQKMMNTNGKKLDVSAKIFATSHFNTHYQGHTRCCTKHKFVAYISDDF